MNGLRRRLDALEKPSRYVTLGQLLDHLQGDPLPRGSAIDPALVAALAALPPR